MATEKHYSEEEAIEKFQSGEYGYVEFVTHVSKDCEDEYYEYCKKHNLRYGEESAKQFDRERNELLMRAEENGDV
ncbi:MAG: hypothetical protein LUC22_05540 [Prevotella sp.]|nr:hypothetical protein [Prevotella sp.]